MNDFNTARDYVNQGEYEKAIPILEQLLKNSIITENSKNLCMIENMRAMCLINLNEMNTAKTILEGILKVEPDNIMANSNLKVLCKSLLNNSIKEADEALDSDQTGLLAKSKYQEILSKLDFEKVEKGSNEDNLYTHAFYNYLYLLEKLKEENEALEAIQNYLLYFNRGKSSLEVSLAIEEEEENIEKENKNADSPPLHMLQLISSLYFKTNEKDNNGILIQKLENYLSCVKKKLQTTREHQSYFLLAFNFANFYSKQGNSSKCLQQINWLKDEINIFLEQHQENEVEKKSLKDLYLRAVYLQSYTLAGEDRFDEAFEISKSFYVIDKKEIEGTKTDLDDTYIECSLNYGQLYAEKLSKKLNELEKEDVKENDKITELIIDTNDESTITSSKEKETIYMDICRIYNELLGFYTGERSIINDEKIKNNSKFGSVFMKLHYNYSILLSKQKKIEEAINHLEVILNFFYNWESKDNIIEANIYFNSIANIGYHLVQKKQYTKALKILEDFLQKHSIQLKSDVSKKETLIRILKNTSSAAMHIPNFTVAIMRLTEILELTPEDENIRNALEACQQQLIYLGSLRQKQDKKDKEQQENDETSLRQKQEQEKKENEQPERDDIQTKEGFFADIQSEKFEMVNKKNSDEDRDDLSENEANNPTENRGEEKVYSAYDKEPSYEEELENDFEEFQLLRMGHSSKEYTIHPYKNLIWPTFFNLKFDEKIPYDKREMYLSDSDFKKYFKGMTHEEFYDLPKWRRDLMKRSVKLF